MIAALFFLFGGGWIERVEIKRFDGAERSFQRAFRAQPLHQRVIVGAARGRKAGGADAFSGESVSDHGVSSPSRIIDEATAATNGIATSRRFCRTGTAREYRACCRPSVDAGEKLRHGIEHRRRALT